MNFHIVKKELLMLVLKLHSDDGLPRTKATYYAKEFLATFSKIIKVITENLKIDELEQVTTLIDCLMNGGFLSSEHSLLSEYCDN